MDHAGSVIAPLTAASARSTTSKRQLLELLQPAPVVPLSSRPCALADVSPSSAVSGQVTGSTSSAGRLRAAVPRPHLHHRQHLRPRHAWRRPGRRRAPGRTPHPRRRRSCWLSRANRRPRARPVAMDRERSVQTASPCTVLLATSDVFDPAPRRDAHADMTARCGRSRRCRNRLGRVAEVRVAGPSAPGAPGPEAPTAKEFIERRARLASG
jgi:hypothetical protein